MTVRVRLAILLATACAALAAGLVAAPAPALAANGCGPAGFGWIVPDRPLGFDFHVGCQHHDACYSTPWWWVARSRPAAKLACDQRFLADLDAACWPAAAAGPRRLRLCLSVAFDYYRAVRTWIGELAYRRAQR